MKVIGNLKEFRRRTILVVDLDFEFINITPNSRLGIFNRERLSELVDFCKDNPEYHIISFLENGGVEINDAVEAAALYMLGRGDKDPDLMYVPRLSDDARADLEILKFNID